MPVALVPDSVVLVGVPILQEADAWLLHEEAQFCFVALSAAEDEAEDRVPV